MNHSLTKLDELHEKMKREDIARITRQVNNTLPHVKIGYHWLIFDYQPFKSFFRKRQWFFEATFNSNSFPSFTICSIRVMGFLVEFCYGHKTY